MEELTVEQAARELGFKEMTVYTYIQQGKIIAVRHGRNVRIRREDNAELFTTRRALIGGAVATA